MKNSTACRAWNILAILLLCSAISGAQQFSNNHIDEKLFVVEVKQIDEFLERFNDEHFSFIRSEYRNKGYEKDLTRPQLLARLFNVQNTDWNKDTLLQFMYHVLDPQKPVVLSFRDSNWYAEATCRFIYRAKIVTIPILFHIKTVNPKGARWMIAGIGNPSFLNSLPDNDCDGRSSSMYHFIASSSHINGFVSLHRVFGDNTNLSDYFEPYLLEQEPIRKFIKALCIKNLVLKEVSGLKFHFFQVDQWLFTVERFDRKTTNKGWLINKLMQVSPSQKEFIRYTLLFPN